MPHVSVVHPSIPVSALNDASSENEMWAFFAELRARGYLEGKNIRIERHSGVGQADRFAQLAREVIETRPDIIVVTSRRLLQHFHEATTTIPIIAAGTLDPVGYGVAASLARPGRNVTGFTTDAGLDVLIKHVQLLREVSSTARRIAWLAPEETWAGRYGSLMLEAAKVAGSTLIGPGLGNPIREAEYRRVFTAMAAEKAQGLIVGDVTDNHTHAKLISDLANSLAVPAIYPRQDYVRHGGLMAYAVQRGAVFRGAAEYVDRVLKGEKPGDLPFQQPIKFDLILNIRAAKSLGIEVPPTLLARADEVIE